MVKPDKGTASLHEVVTSIIAKYEVRPRRSTSLAHISGCTDDNASHVGRKSRKMAKTSVSGDYGRKYLILEDQDHSVIMKPVHVALLKNLSGYIHDSAVSAKYA